MTQPELLTAISRLSRKLVRCTDQAECDRMEAELAELRAKVAPNSTSHTRGD